MVVTSSSSNDCVKVTALTYDEMSIDGTVGAAAVASFTPTLLFRYIAIVYASFSVVVGFAASFVSVIWPVLISQAKFSAFLSLILSPMTK
jgi:hypothetical protein